MCHPVQDIKWNASVNQNSFNVVNFGVPPFLQIKKYYD